MTQAPSTEASWLTFADGYGSQPVALNAAVSRVGEQLAAGVADGLRGRSVLLAGIGASFAATATPLYVLRQAGVIAQRTSCGELPAETAPLADYYVGVSQSGRSRETVELLQRVPPERRVAVVNRVASPLAEVSDTVLSIGELADSRMSSAGFTGTVVALGMLADWLARGTVEDGWAGLGARAAEVAASAEERLAGFAAAATGSAAVDVVAHAASLTSAEQGALLLREGPRVPATGMETRSYLHGPMDVAGPTAHVLCGGPREALLAEQLAEKGVPILLITAESTTAPATVVQIPALPPCQRVIVEVLLLQRLVQQIGQTLGRDVDESVFRRLDTKVDSPDQARGGQR